MQNSALHRLDRPVVIVYYSNGNKQTESWFRYDKRHSKNTPAIIKYCINGDKHWESWYQNNKLHRLDGPAYIDYVLNIGKYYYLNGERLTKEQFKQHIDIYVGCISDELNLYFDDVNLIPIVTNYTFEN